MTVVGGDDQPAAVFGHVLLVQHGGHTQDGLQHVLGGSLVNRGSVSAEVVSGRDGAGGSALVGSGRTFGHEVVKEHFVFDGDLQLLGGVFREHVHQVHVGLIGQHVVDLHAEVLALVDLHVLEDRGGHFVVQVHTSGVVADADGRSHADTDGIALVLQLTFVVGVGDLRQHGVLVELGQQLAGPQGGDESTRVRGVRIERGLDGVNSSHGGLLKTKTGWSSSRFHFQPVTRPSM